MFLLLSASGFGIVMRQLFSCQRYLTLIILSELSDVRKLSLLKNYIVFTTKIIYPKIFLVKRLFFNREKGTSKKMYQIKRTKIKICHSKL